MFLKSIIIFLVFMISLFAKGKVTKIYAHYEDASPSQYSKNGHTYKWGQGKNIVIDGFEYNNHKYNYTGAYGNVIVKVRRSDNSNASGKPCELFAVKHNNNNYQYTSTFPQKDGKCDMATVMGGRIISVGALDLFRNTGYSAKNIERVDFITPNGITAPTNSADLAKAGHVVTEKSGNNPIKIAAILSLDANGDPASYGPLVGVHTGEQIDYGLTTIYFPDGSTSYSRSQAFLIDNKHSSQGYPYYYGTYNEALGMAFVSLQDLGISAGQKYYGFSYFGRDVTNSMNLVNYNSFPKNTDGDTADPYGGVEGYFVDESITPPTCENTFGGVLNSTLDKISTSGTNLIFNNKKPLVTKKLISGGITTCDYSPCKLTNTLAPKYDFTVDTGSGKDGVFINYPQTLNDSKEFTNFTLTGSSKLYINGNNTYKVQNSVIFSGNSEIYINGIVTIEAKDITIMGTSKLNIQNGYLILKASNSVSYGAGSISQSKNPLDLVILSKGNITYMGTSKLKSLCYADGKINFSGSGTFVGSATSEKISTSGAYTLTYDKDAVNEFCHPTPQTENTCESTFPSAVSSTYDEVQINQDSKIYGTSNHTIITKNLKTSSGVKCDDDICVKSNTLADTMNFTLDLGNGSDGEKILDDGSSITISSNKEYKKFQAGKNSDITINGDVTIKSQSDFYINSNSKIHINGNVVIYADKFDSNQKGVFYINGSLKIYANTFYLNSGNKSQHIPSADKFVVFAKKIVDINSYVDLKGIFYSDGDIQINDHTKITGALTGNYIDINKNSIINYDKDAINEFCRPQPSTEGICYALDDTKSKLYKVHMEPGASPLPVATKISLQNLTKSLNGEAEAYNSENGLIYAFHEGHHYPTLYSIDPSNGQVTKIKKLNFMKKNVTGASFYGGYFYVLAKHPGKNTLYKINTSNWSLIFKQDLNGDTDEGDGLAINEDGEAYIINDNHNKIYTIDLNTANTNYLTQIHTNQDAEALSFAKDGFIYTENSEDGTSSDTDKLFKINLSDGSLTPAAQIPHSDDIDIEGLSCNTEAGSSTSQKINITVPNSIDIVEGDNGTKNISISLSADDTIPSDVSFNYTFSNGSAIKGSDYQDGSLSFSGSTITISNVILGDKKVESDEYFYVTLSSSDNRVAFVNNKVKVNIINDDVKFIITECPTMCKDKIGTKIINLPFSINIFSVDENKNPIKNEIAKDVQAKIKDLSTWQNIDIFNKTEVKNVSFISSKALKNTKIELKWTNTKTNKTETQNSTDNFAIRPKEFKFTLPTTPQNAGDNFTFKVEALDNSGNPSQNYNEHEGVSFIFSKKEQKSPTCVTGILTLSKFLNFTNGLFLDNTAQYDNVGVIDLNISEKNNGSEFAAVDRGDTPDSKRLVASASATMTFIPKKFAVNSTLTDITSDNITFYADSSSVSSMGANLDINISATTASGGVLTNYTNGCYSKDTNLTMYYTNSNTADSHTIISDKTITSQDASKFIITIDKSSYSSGITKQNIKLNLSRDNKVVKNPSLFTINKIKANDSTTSTEVTLTNNNKAHFYYGRAHVASPQETSGTNMDAKVYYEVYCKNCNKTTFPRANGQASIDSVYWYILPSSVYSNFGSGVCDYNSPRASNGATPSRNNEATLHITVPKAPYSDKIYYTPNQTYLQYNKFGTALPEHYFDVSFTSSTAVWAGKGKLGKTVDTNISKIPNRALEW